MIPCGIGEAGNPVPDAGGIERRMVEGTGGVVEPCGEVAAEGGGEGVGRDGSDFGAEQATLKEEALAGAFHGGSGELAVGIGENDIVCLGGGKAGLGGVGVRRMGGRRFAARKRGGMAGARAGGERGGDLKGGEGFDEGLMDGAVDFGGGQAACGNGLGQGEGVSMIGAVVDDAATGEPAQAGPRKGGHGLADGGPSLAVAKSHCRFGPLVKAQSRATGSCGEVEQGGIHGHIMDGGSALNGQVEEIG